MEGGTIQLRANNKIYSPHLVKEKHAKNLLNCWAHATKPDPPALTFVPYPAVQVASSMLVIHLSIFKQIVNMYSGVQIYCWDSGQLLNIFIIFYLVGIN